MSLLARLALLLASLLLLALAGTRAIGLALFSAPGRPSEARQASLERTLQIDPSNGLAWLQLAQLLLGRGDLPRAQQAAEQAMITLGRYQPHQLRAQILFGRSLQDPAVRFQALEQFDRLIAVSPGDQLSLTRAARVALLNREPARARRYLDQADRVEITPDDPRPQDRDLLLMRVQVAQAEGDWPEVGRTARVAALLNPDAPEFLAPWAEALAHGAPVSREAYSFVRRQWRRDLPPSRVRHLLPLARGGADPVFSGRMVLEAMVTGQASAEREGETVDDLAAIWQEARRQLEAEQGAHVLASLIAAPETLAFAVSADAGFSRFLEEIGVPASDALAQSGTVPQILRVVRAVSAHLAATGPGGADAPAILANLVEGATRAAIESSDLGLQGQALTQLVSMRLGPPIERRRILDGVRAILSSIPAKGIIKSPGGLGRVDLLRSWLADMRLRGWSEVDLLSLHDDHVVRLGHAAITTGNLPMRNALAQLIEVRAAWGAPANTAIMDLMRRLRLGVAQ